MTMLEFCELPKRKKEKEKKHTNKTKKLNDEIKKIKSRKKEEIFSFSVENVNLGRDNRVRKILPLACSFRACTRFVLARREEYLRDRERGFRTIACDFPSLFFFSLSV